MYLNERIKLLLYIIIRTKRNTDYNDCPQHHLLQVLQRNTLTRCRHITANKPALKHQYQVIKDEAFHKLCI